MMAVDPQGSTYNLASPNHVTFQNVGQSDNARVYGRQISAGNIRGNQNITGTLTIVSPTTNTPTISLSGDAQSINIGSSSSPTISIDGTKDYILVTDPTTQVSQLVMGKLPDGNYGMVVSKTGVDVLEVFS